MARYRFGTRLVVRAAAALLLIAVVGIAAAVAAPDTTQPTVQIDRPKNDFRTWGEVNVQVAAADPAGLKQAAIYVDGQQVKTCDLSGTAGYCQYSWQTAEMPDGQHTVMARAWDAQGNEVTSPAITGCVSNNSLTGTLEARASEPVRRGEMVPLQTTQSDPYCGLSKTYVFVRPTWSHHYYLKGVCTTDQCDTQWNTRYTRRGEYVVRAVAWNAAQPMRKVVSDVTVTVR